MTKLVYLGTAKDHEVIPQTYHEGQNGKPDKREGVKREAVTKYVEMKEFTLWGTTFIKGVPREVGNTKLIEKALALKCFKIALDEPPKKESKDGEDGGKKPSSRAPSPKAKAE